MAQTTKNASSVQRAPAIVVALFILPAFALFAAVLLYPMASALGYSLFEWRGGTNLVRFNWFDNFVVLFTEHPFVEQMPRAFLHNIAIFAGTLVLQNSAGLFLAVQLHRLGPVRRLFQVLYTTPYLVSPLVVGYLWTLLLSPTFGPVNAALDALGLDSLAVSWLGEPATALPVLILVSVWQWIGFPVLLYGAALGAIPPELNDAASVDGAGGWRRFRHVTLPLLTPVIGTVSILTFIGAMEMFTLPYAFGGATGSPAGATDVLSVLFFRVSFQSGASNALGVSSALATLLFLFILGGALLGRRVIRAQEEKLS
ncbi:sugar ABC transporter permease [Acrocarpospora macrocephala]|uniref:Sugar ABC transporter permease n=1 Tax=Acrocarpospora macrocephala TaxID=150177 RepID=A0A5M3X3V8_9ACTN|nr:sugar ABC transporter permease [Acrocarpospora macrocephala]GES15750.1 sugar ABC transporter permease [Acrocarpospora macrocephala]